VTESGGAVRAAVDIGTVSTRMLVARVTGSRIEPISRRTVVTHLGEGVARVGAISPTALERTLGTVRAYREEALEAGARSIPVIATSAARDANNGEEFLAALRDLGLDPRIVSGRREAELSFAGATYSLRERDVLVADLGGGSTELVFGSVSEEDGEVEVDVESARSVDVGSRRATDLFLATDPPTSGELAEAAAWVAEQVRPFFDGLKERPRRMIALGGTATSLAAVRLGLSEYDGDVVHGSALSGADLADLREELAAMDLERRRGVAGLDPARADVIVGGVLVLETLLGLAGLDAVAASEHDILYGLLMADD
jgi:exopolyphosphatase/guanosine-5'-triphosphate,3'-diphosphate pyrophosphatase